MAASKSDSKLTKMQIDDDNDSDEEMEMDAQSESKESDTTQDDDVEEGELSDSKTTDSPQAASPLVMKRTRRYDNVEGGFITGVLICGKEEQSKLDERAKRFGLDPSTVKPLTEHDVKKLYVSLGMTTDEGIDKSFRLDALHMRGTEDMSTKDIFTYFRAFGPASVEWINDYTCNVVWLEESSAARALLGLSRQIKGLEKLHKRSEDGTKNTDEKEGKEEIVVTEDESDSDEDAEMVNNSVSQHRKSAGARTIVAASIHDDEDDAVDIDTIKIPIPPGKWRVGVSHPKAKNILLRFATRSDKKHPRAEKLSEYYKKYGNPNYGGIPGILTESRKRRFRWNDQHVQRKHTSIRGEDRDENQFRTAKNPWGSLAKSWGNTGNPEQYNRFSPPRRTSQIIPSQVAISHGLHGSNSQRQFAQVSDSETASSSSDDEEMLTRTKVPRMRMYADEEEIKIEKRKAQRSKRTHEHEEDTRRQRQSDLRHRLRREAHGQSVEKYRSRERVRQERGSERSRHRISSTVWSRLRYRESKDELVGSEIHDVERKRTIRPTSEKQIHSDDSDELLTKPLHMQFGDLRSKLNSMKTVRQKSPLRIEIDNDEYYRVIGSESD